jgi:predicted MFS family arabinose efflux permease
MQVIWSRILSMIIGSSTYAFTMVLALFLTGLAIGAWIVGFRKKTETTSLRRFVFSVQLLIVFSLFLSFLFTNSVPGLLIRLGFALAINFLARTVGVAGFRGNVAGAASGDVDGNDYAAGVGLDWRCQRGICD